MENRQNLSESSQRDLELINAAKSGVENAFMKLMDHYKNAINFMILKMVHNKFDAEELTMEAFGKAFTKIHTYEPNYAFSTWLFRIASNCAIDHLRKKRVATISYEQSDRSGIVNFKEIVFSAKSDSDNPEESIVKMQNSIIVRKTVSRLKPHFRSLIEMRYFKDYSYAEIAEELNLPLGTVKIQLYRSHAVLYNLLQNTDLAH